MQQDDQTSPESLRKGPGRKITIQSGFGNARQWRSRKSRPCDTCRRRKTTYVTPERPPYKIFTNTLYDPKVSTDAPEGGFCKSRGLICRSSSVTGSSGPLEVEGPSDVDGTLRLPAAATPLPESPSPFARRAVSAHGAGSRSATSAHESEVQQLRGQFIANADDDLVPSPSPEAGSLYRDPGRDLSVPPVHRTSNSQQLYTLGDNHNRTAHSMGLAAEQDTYLLDVCRSAIINEQDEVDANIIQVYSGDLPLSQPPVHFLLVENEFPPQTNRAMREASDAIENVVHPFGKDLIRLSKEGMPVSLRGAIYALASAFWAHDPSLPSPCPFAQHDIVQQAHISLRHELEAPNLFKLQACLLLLHIQPPDVDSIEMPSTWILTAQATACAQMIGLHRNPEPWNIPAWEKTLPPLNMADLRSDEIVPRHLQHLLEPEDNSFRVALAARFLEMVRVAQLLHEILNCS
ncbi:fungal specific transcription factor domain-containing protein [Seiridium cupressi]